MTFTAEQNAALSAPLSRDSVKTRQQSGRNLSYIESWKAISEANRIFGFDGWSRETVEIQRVSEYQRKVGQGEGWGVTYTAKVRVTVGDVVREGVGAGHGIDRDLGQAHESAIKEAESDAGKRALMTFGNPFGLALYDKEQAEVEDAPTKPPTKPTQPQTPPPPALEQSGTKTPQAWAQMAIDRVPTLATKADLEAFETKYLLRIAKLAPVVPDLHKKLVADIADRHFVLEGK